MDHVLNWILVNKWEITPANVMTVADEWGNKQTEKLCLADVANEFKKKV